MTAPWLGSRLDRAARPALLLAALATVIGAGIGVIGAGLGAVPIVILCLVAVGWSVAEPAVMGGLSGIGSRSSVGDGRFETADATSYGAAAVAGQAVVALTVLAAGPWTAVAVLVTLAFAAAVLIVGLPLRPVPVEEASGGHVRAALGLIGRDRELRSMTVLTTISMSAVGGLALAAVGVAEANGRDADAASVAVLAMATGAVVGSLSSRRLGVAAHPVAWSYASVATVGLSFALAAVVPWSAAVALFAIAGFADGPLLTATFAVRTTRTPLRLRASVYTIAASAKIAGSALGAVVVRQHSSRRPTPRASSCWRWPRSWPWSAARSAGPAHRPTSASSATAGDDRDPGRRAGVAGGVNGTHDPTPGAVHRGQVEPAGPPTARRGHRTRAGRAGPAPAQRHRADRGPSCTPAATRGIVLHGHASGPGARMIDTAATRSRGGAVVVVVGGGGCGGSVVVVVTIVGATNTTVVGVVGGGGAVVVVVGGSGGWAVAIVVDVVVVDDEVVDVDVDGGRGRRRRRGRRRGRERWGDLGHASRRGRGLGRFREHDGRILRSGDAIGAVAAAEHRGRARRRGGRSSVAAAPSSRAGRRAPVASGVGNPFSASKPYGRTDTATTGSVGVPAAAVATPGGGPSAPTAASTSSRRWAGAATAGAIARSGTAAYRRLLSAHVGRCSTCRATRLRTSTLNVPSQPRRTPGAPGSRAVRPGRPTNAPRLRSTRSRMRCTTT